MYTIRCKSGAELTVSERIANEIKAQLKNSSDKKIFREFEEDKTASGTFRKILIDLNEIEYIIDKF